MNFNETSEMDEVEGSVKAEIARPERWGTPSLLSRAIKPAPGIGHSRVSVRWSSCCGPAIPVLPRSRAAGFERQQGCTQSGSPTTGADLTVFRRRGGDTAEVRVEPDFILASRVLTNAPTDAAVQTNPLFLP